MNWLRALLVGDDQRRPSITPAQWVAGIPLVGNLLAAYGVFTPSPAQEQSLRLLILWALGLFAGDAIVRAGRNIGDGLAKKRS